MTCLRFRNNLKTKVKEKKNGHIFKWAQTEKKKKTAANGTLANYDRRLQRKPRVGICPALFSECERNLCTFVARQ